MKYKPKLIWQTILGFDVWRMTDEQCETTSSAL
jgi:hypothetical protein